MLDIGRDQRSNGGQHERDGQRGRDGKQTGRPARQDAGAQRRDAKEEATEDIPDPDERIERWEGSEVHAAHGSRGAPQEAIHKLGRRGRQQRQDKGCGEDKGRLERPTEAQQEKACQTKPPGLFHLPGVDPCPAQQEEEAHGVLQGGDDGPGAGGD